MALVDMSEFYTEIRTVAPSCPRPTVDRHLRNAAIRLCEEAKCHRVDLDPALIIANIGQVELDLPSGSRVHEVITASIDGQRLEPTTPKLLSYRDPNWAEPGRPYAYYLESPNTLRLAATPDAQGLWLDVNAAIKPTRTATQLDEYLVENFFDTIVAGALTNILMLPDRPFTDPGKAQMYGMAFSNGVQNAKRHGQRTGSGKQVRCGYGGI